MDQVQPPTGDGRRTPLAEPWSAPPLLPTGEGRRFERHAFVCTNQEACAIDGPAEAIQKAFKERLRAAGLKESLRVSKSGCLGQCGHGPMMVVYPEGVWYSHVGLGDVERIWSEHLLGGKPVEELRYHTAAAGTNVLGRPQGAPPQPVGGPHSSRCTRCPG